MAGDKDLEQVKKEAAAKAKAAAAAKAKAAAAAKAKADAAVKAEEDAKAEVAGATEAPEKVDDKAKAAAAAKAKAAAAAKAKAAAAAKAKAAAQAKTEAEEPADGDAKAKAAAAAKAKAAAAAKHKAAAQAKSETEEPADGDAKAKAAAAAKAKAAAVAKAKASGSSDASGDEKAKAIAAAKAKAAAAAKHKAAASPAKTEDASTEEAKPSPNQPFLDKYVRVIEEHLGKEVLEDYYINNLSKDVPTLVAKRDSYYKIAQFMKYNEQLGFDYLSELHGSDFETHMEVYAHFYSYKNRQSVALKVKIDRENPEIESLAALWAGADWPECEAYDLLGIKFLGHPNLHRILLGEDWKGYPLRKDYEPYDVEV